MDLVADGLTCMSDGLEAALRLARPDERTTVTIHSDGYVNDPDPASDSVSDYSGHNHALALALSPRLKTDTPSS